MEYFPSFLDNNYPCSICGYLGIVSTTYITNFKHKGDEIAMKVALGVMKKIFFKIEYSQLFIQGQKLIEILPPVIERLQHSELMFPIIDILNLCVLYLEKQYDRPCATLKKHFEQICVLFQKVYCRIECDFPDDKKMSKQFFKVVLNSLGNCKLNTWFKDQVMHIFCMAGMLPENHKHFCTIIISKFNHNLFLCFDYLCDICLKVSNSRSSLKLFITLTLMTVENLYMNFDSANDVRVEDAPHFFSSLVDLCYACDSLAGYVWINLFPSLWEILKDSERKILSNKLRKIVRNLSSNEYSPIPNLNDVFIKAALKCNLDFIHHIDSKYIHRSQDFQVFFSILLEKPLSLRLRSTQEINKYIHVLNKVYTHLEEETFYCFNQIYGNHIPRTLKAMTLFQDGKFGDAHNLYTEIIKDNFPSENSVEKQFCDTQLNKCAYELARWRYYSSEANCHTPLENIQILSKWVSEKKDDEQNNTSESLTLQCYICNCDIKEATFQHSKEEIPGLINLCSKTFQSLPSVLLSRQQYSLLQLAQQLTELSEAWSVSKVNENHTVPKLSKELYATCTDWYQRPYLISDDFNFLTELFHVRQVAFKNRQKELKNLNCSDIFRDYINSTLAHEINNCAIDLCSVALIFQNRYIRDLRFPVCSFQNIFKWNQVQLMYLLKEAKRLSIYESKLTLCAENNSSVSSQRRSIADEKEDCVLKSLDLVNPKLTKFIGSDKKKILESLQLKILKEFKLEECCNTYVLHNPDSSEAWDILSEFYLNIYNQSSDISNAVTSMHCLIQACKFGNDSSSLKLITKIIYLLELDDEHFSIGNPLMNFYCSIPASYWISFLPILISHLHCSMKKDVTEKESPNLLCRVLTCILINIGQAYPQQVFLALQCLENIDYQVNAEGLQLTSKKILMALKEKHPYLINVLQNIVKIFQHFKPNFNQICLYKCKEKLETYTQLFQNFKSKQNIDSEKNLNSILDSLEKAFECDFKLLKFLEPDINKIWIEKYKEELKHPACLNRLKFGTQEHVFVFLKESIDTFLENNKKFQSQNMYDEVMLLSNFCFAGDININLFGQNPLTDPLYQVKIHKFLPKVDVVKWDDGLTWKIHIKGNDGKDYPFLFLEDLCRHQTLNSMKLKQFLEFLNPLLEKHVRSERSFLKICFPRATPTSSYNMLVPQDNGLFLYQDIYKMHIRKLKDFSAAENFFAQLYQNEVPTDEKLEQVFKLVQLEVPKDIFTNWVEKLYPHSSVDLYSFKKQFLKHLSLLVAEEICFKISMRKQFCVMKNTGAVSSLHLKLNLDDAKFTTDLLTPNVTHFLGPVKIREMTEYIVCVVSCLKENKDFISQLLQIVKQEYSLEEHEKMKKFADSVMDKLECLDRTEVQKLLQSSKELKYLCSVNPVFNPWF